MFERLRRWLGTDFRPQVGGVYSVLGQRGIAIAKVLAVEPGVLHVRLYKERFQRRPQQVDTTALTLGSIEDEDGVFGIGHLPLEEARFTSWDPRLIHVEEVGEDELHGYRIWEDAQGGVWD